MDEVIGLSVRNLLDLVEEVHGKQAREEVLAALPPTSRARFTERIVVSDWYPLSEHLLLHGAVRDTLYGADPSAGVDLGRRLARRRLDMFSRMFLWFRDPAYILRRSATTWSFFLRPSRMVNEVVTPTGMVARIVGMEAPLPDRFYCNVLAGYFATILEAAGAKDLSLQHTTCRSEGGPHCEYRAEWK